MSDKIYWLLALAAAVAATLGGWLYIVRLQLGGRWIQAGYTAFCIALLAAGVVWYNPNASRVGHYAMMPLLTVIALEDFRSHRIANRLLLILLAIGSVCLIMDWEHAVTKVFALVGYGGVFILISLISRNGFGMGDAKLIGVMGLFFGMIDMMTALFAASIIICLAGIVALLRTKNLKTEVPFAPAMLLGALTAITLIS